MAKALFICYRHPPDPRQELEARLKRIARRLDPDPVEARPPSVSVRERLAWMVTNPPASLNATPDGLLLGAFLDGARQWAEISGESGESGSGSCFESPDGSYAIFRTDDRFVEILSDPGGSRTIWYYRDSGRFVAGTSQRAILMALGDLQFDRRAVPWFLSTGSPGPVHGWDRRLRRLGADSVLRLKRQDWRLSVEQRAVRFSPQERPEDSRVQPGGSAANTPNMKGAETGREDPDTHWRQRLRRALEASIGGLKLDYRRWWLPLSGGVDSRGLLFWLPRRDRGGHSLQAFSYGLESSRSRPGSDVQIAEELADEQKVPHRFFPTDLSREPVDELVERFLRAGEGRTDRIEGYMDGFTMWKKLHEAGVEGILRGDEGFGWTPVEPTELSVRGSVELWLCRDYQNLSGPHMAGLPEQRLPDILKRKSGETHASWRDRLYHHYRLPTVIAALNDLKLGYVELINPLLTRRILSVVRSMPDRLRTDKRLFRELVAGCGSDIEYATSGGGPWAEDLLRSPRMVSLIRRTLGSESAEKIFSNKLLAYVLENMEQANGSSGRPKESGSGGKNGKRARPGLRLKRLIYRILRRATGSRLVKKRLDPNRLALRVCLIVLTRQMLERDSEAFSTPDRE